ncbi:hypothetical protein BDW02DRAFT_630140 [Decorospora gaudefroyi]|uniref:DUF7918 domain-containing protein n=1 Tax=Decorospora gaudefroyi TaxID=184978 RepID=A0A6A5KBQ9_9PLEO|nr:hypothetical protein BDW02DRAFT_630140 [Decorospora gaudefroyi]
MHYRSIEIALHSQFDIETLPEYYPDPREHYVARGITGFTPELVDDRSSTCSVYVPVLAGSTFWIGYSVSPPVPDGHYFLFKLYINGAHTMSWSTGKEEHWQGKTMFGLFETPEDEDGKKRIEKRILCFTPPNSKDKAGSAVADMFDEKARVEIRVHRANGRKRIERQTQEYSKTQHAKDGKGISLVSAGRAGAEQPKRFYKFALIDPIDQPFATFNYYYRSWDQLRGLGLLEQHHSGIGEENDLSVIEPQEGSVYETGEAQRTRSSASNDTNDVFQDCSEVAHEENSLNETKEAGPSQRLQTLNGSGLIRARSIRSRRPSSAQVSIRRVSHGSEQPRAYIPSGAPNPEGDRSGGRDHGQTQQRESFLHTPPQFYRLSVPPSVRLDPPEQASRPLPTIPQKSNSASSTSYRPHPAYPVDEWTVRTPSPVKSVREGISTPPLGKRGEQPRSASALMSAIASAWRRRGTQTPDGAASTDDTEGVPSLSQGNTIDDDNRTAR